MRSLVIAVNLQKVDWILLRKSLDLMMLELESPRKKERGFLKHPLYKSKSKRHRLGIWFISEADTVTITDKKIPRFTEEPSGDGF